MNAEFLVASLWGVVAVYWLWSRRPAGGDSIGSFRYELHVLEHATPMRVSPANSRCPQAAPLAALGALVTSAPDHGGARGLAGADTWPAQGPSGYRVSARSETLEVHQGQRPLSRPARSAPTSMTPPLRSAARDYRRAEVRRRRRDVLVVLAVLVVVTVAIAAVRSTVSALALQAMADLVLAGYVFLLVQTKPRDGLVPMATVATVAMPRARRAPAQFAPPTAAPLEPRRAETVRAETVRAERAQAKPAQAEMTIDLDDYVGTDAPHQHLRPAHLRPASPAPQPEWASSYGDFGSYASLALARAN